MAETIRARSFGERLGAAALFLGMLFSSVGLLVAVIVFFFARRRRPFAAAAGLQAAALLLLFAILVLALFGVIAATQGGTIGLRNWLSLVESLLHGRYVYLLLADKIFIGIFAGIIVLELIAALSGIVLALTGRLFPLPLRPAWLARVTGAR